MRMIPCLLLLMTGTVPEPNLVAEKDFVLEEDGQCSYVEDPWSVQIFLVPLEKFTMPPMLLT